MLPHVQPEVGHALGVIRVLRERRRPERVRDVGQRVVHRAGDDGAHPLREQPPRLALGSPAVDQQGRLGEGCARSVEPRVDRAQVHEQQSVGAISGRGPEQRARQPDRAAVPAGRDLDPAPVEPGPLEVPAGRAHAAGRHVAHAQRPARHLHEPAGGPRAGHDLDAGLSEVDGEEAARAVVDRGGDERVRQRSGERAPRLRAGQPHRVRPVGIRHGRQRIAAALGREHAPRARRGTARVRVDAPRAVVARGTSLLLEDRERVQVRLHRARDAEVGRGERRERLPEVRRAARTRPCAAVAERDRERQRPLRRPLRPRGRLRERRAHERDSGSRPVIARRHRAGCEADARGGGRVEGPLPLFHL